MSYHQPLHVPGAFPRARAGLRPSVSPIGARSARVVEVSIGPVAMPEPFGPAVEDVEPADGADGAEDIRLRLREQMLQEIEQALQTGDAAIAGFHVGLATLYARRLATGQANPG